MKHVPSYEYHLFEGVRTNVMGAQILIDAAIDQQVQHIMALSSDKAVNSINL